MRKEEGRRERARAAKGNAWWRVRQGGGSSEERRGLGQKEVKGGVGG